MTARTLILILGDQLDASHAALRAGDPSQDVVVMLETLAEARHVWSHRQRVTLFLSAMRHYRDELRSAGWTVDYATLADEVPDLAAGLTTAIARHQPARACMVEAGEHRVQQQVASACAAAGVPLEVLADTHFLCTTTEFAAWAKARKQLVMEYFYRWLRTRLGVLMDDGKPAGGRWNFDAENRKGYGRSGPGPRAPVRRFPPDAITREVLDEVANRLPDHPGALDAFGWPVTRADALAALHDFITHRLPRFGDHQDAMWTGEPWLEHALLASSLNLKLLDPREVVAAAEAAYRAGHVPIASAEGFIRQIIGWREYVRGVYWLKMPDYAAGNVWRHERPLPEWFWTGDVDMNCLRHTVNDTLAHGYAHHIQRLMVVGNFAVLAGLLPQSVCDWFLAAYVDAVEWVELPNTLGMALNADGGVLATKPYVASGRYLERMSNYCAGCRFEPGRRSGEDACPYTVLYWDFLRRHRGTLGRNPRMATILKNLDRFGADELDAIARQAGRLRDRYAPLPPR
ncbi:MAG: cryptochrome/photolyase family protein [Chromatiales bacterium]|jgi:deoxyribodipyrimidine photolyase-related protein|nr:cryptochrome/photolyase family protein [Chromatiales bacterium]